jgi:hypothetical protein
MKKVKCSKKKGLPLSKQEKTSQPAFDGRQHICHFKALTGSRKRGFDDTSFRKHPPRDCIRLVCQVACWNHKLVGG